MHRRRLFVAATAALIALLAVRHPVADISFSTHDLADPAPRRLHAAIDLGLAGISVAYSWSDNLRR